MCPELKHAWMSESGEHFADDGALARHLAARIDAGEEGVLFSREGCMFRLTYADGPHPTNGDSPVAAFWRNRTYSVTLVTNSSTCVGGNVFTATWPDDYAYEPVQVIAKDAPSDAPVFADGTMRDISGVLTAIGVVLWPELYDL